MTRYLFGCVVVCSDSRWYEILNTPRRQIFCVVCNESHFCMWYRGEYLIYETVWYLD